jgi:ATP adenylyltransferase
VPDAAAGRTTPDLIAAPGRLAVIGLESVGGAVAGTPDGLERLWTPHRMLYVTGAEKPESGYDSAEGCPFCRAPERPVEDGLVVARGERVYAVLNLYPYNPGHLMICPYRHVADYTDLDDTETVEFSQFTQAAMRVIRRVSAPHGFNLGVNQGHVAGAGIAAHLHQHVVPRWGGDTNFMPIISRTKSIPQLLADTRLLLAKAWEEIAPSAAAVEPSPRRRPRPAKAAPRKATGTTKATASTAASTKGAKTVKRTRRSPAKR